MFVLQIHSVTFYNSSTQNKPRNVFLDISNENQPSRRYFVGRFSTSSTKSCESIVHVSKTPITVHLSYGPLMYHDLGPQTIYDFLYEDVVHLGKKKFLTFGRRGPLYHVCYSVSPVKYSYGYSLTKISCLKQITSQKDELFAEVEFNHSPQSIGLGPTNRYHLGNFVSHDMTEIHSVHNLTFTTLVNFVITFYVKTQFAEYILGTLKFTPTHEINPNVHQLPTTGIPSQIGGSGNHQQQQSSSSFINGPPIMIQSSTLIIPPPLNNHLLNTNNNDNQIQPHHQHQQQASNNNTDIKNSDLLVQDKIINMSNELYNNNHQNNNNQINSQNQNNNNQNNQNQIDNNIINSRNNLINNLHREKGGLFFYRTNDDRVYTFLVDDLSSSKRITLTSPEGRGSYEFVFTLTKTDFMLTYESNNQRSSDAEDIDSSSGGSGSNTNSSNIQSNQNMIGHGQKMILNNNQQSTRYLLPAPLIVDKEDRDGEVNNTTFSLQSEGNEVEVLIDGLQTFRRYYEVMMGAMHSINILAWELSFSFGLVLADRVKQGVPVFPGAPNETLGRWLTLEDVLLARAMAGVSVRIIVWRHELLSHLTRFLYLGEVTIEREAAKLERRCKRLGVACRIYNTMHHNMSDLPLEDDAQPAAGITIVIAGNPQGILSSHHEKLVLVDAECPRHSVAFTGGFDMARGRFDQPLHQIPRQLYSLATKTKVKKEKKDEVSQHQLQQQAAPVRYTGTNIQPALPQIRFLWHDIQVLVKGPATQQLRLHFSQRWIHAFTNNISLTRSRLLTKSDTSIEDAIVCEKSHFPKNKTSTTTTTSSSSSQPLNGVVVEHSDPAPVYSGCAVRLFRVWKGVLDTNLLFDDFGKMILNAKDFLYVEHQYPFQNFTLTYYMCEALKAKPNLHVLIVTPVKTDLPSGLVGELFDWSQDHIIRHLHLIYSVAPDRVGVYGLIRQDEETNRIKPIYIHSKLIVVDDQLFNVGSTNMDNMSFFHSSELCASISDPRLARDTRVRLAKEHLGDHYTESMATNFMDMFNAFKRVSDENYERLRHKRLLIGRPISLNPLDKYEFLLKRIYYPNKMAKLLYKLGVDTEEWLGKMVNPSTWNLKPKL